MALQDQGSGSQGLGSTLYVFLAELGYLTIMLLVVFSSITLLGAIQVFGAFMVVGLIVKTTFLVLVEREERRLRRQVYP
jgi:hypothetical protein